MNAMDELEFSHLDLHDEYDALHADWMSVLPAINKAHTKGQDAEERIDNCIVMLHHILDELKGLDWVSQEQLIVEVREFLHENREWPC